jgi:hypothetical protein
MSLATRLLRTVLTLLLTGSAFGTPGWAADPDLSSGVRQVEEGDYEGALVTLEPVTRRLAPSGGPDAVLAFLYLGIAHMALDQREPARLSFRQALDLDPGLELSPEQFSPKVRGALAEARREREEGIGGAGTSPPASKKGGSGRFVLLAAAGVAAGAGIAVAAGGESSSSSPGEVRFSGARFAPPAIECPDGAVDVPIPVGLEVDATNTGEPVTLNAVSTTLIIVSSPAVPGEVGFASSAPTTSSPSVVPGGMTTLRLQTTLQCSNGAGDEPRFNEWSGRITLATAAAAVTLETVDRLRVNIP